MQSGSAPGVRRIHVGVLGPLEVRLGGEVVELRRVKERILLALLVLHANRVVSVDHLAAGLWEDVDLRPPSTLRVHVSRLRQSLAALGDAAPPLTTSPPGYLLKVPHEDIDAHRFEKLAVEGRQRLSSGDAMGAASAFGQALGLWRGSVLEDLGLSAAIEPEVARLAEARLQTVEDRVDADLVCGRHHRLIAELEELVAENPLRERLWGQRMVALYRSGRQAEALRTYQDLRTLLDDQLGILPSPTLQDLERAVLQQDPVLQVGTFTVPDSPGMRLLVQPVTPTRRGKEMPAPLRLIADQGLAFCGREAQLESLLHTLKEAAAGELRVVLVAGEAGVGKTRLAAETARLARDRGAAVLYGRCDEDLAVPFQPFVEAVTQVALARPGADLLGRHGGELARLVPELPSLVPGLPAPLRADPETERYRLFDAVASWLASFSPAEGALLVVDDLHWADQSTLLLLRHLARSEEPMRVLIVATYRRAELPPAHPLIDVLADLSSDPRVHRMPLEGLDIAGVHGMLCGVGSGVLDETAVELGHLLWSETAGNPLFLQEILRSLVESAVLRDNDGVLTTSQPVTSMRIPDSVRDVVARRLNRLHATTRTVLLLASTTGVVVDFDAVVKMSELNEDVVLDAFDEASAAAIVRETPWGGYEFVHPLVRSALYDSLGAARRARRHRQIAEILLDRPDTDPATVSYHFEQAGATDPRAVDQSASAGDQALDRLAFDEAVTHYSRALEAIGMVGRGSTRPDLECELLIRLGTAQRFATLPAYRETLLKAARLALRLGDADLLASAALANNRGMASSAGAVDADRVRYIEAALGALEPGDSPVRARLLSLLGLETIWDGTLHRLQLLDEALEMARRTGDEACLLDTWMAAHVAGSVPDRVPRLLDESPGLIALAERLGEVQQRAAVYSIAAVHRIQFGQLTEADVLIDRLGRLATEYNLPLLRWVHANHRCCRLTFSGTGDQLEAAALETLQLGQAAGQPDALIWFGPQLLAARWAQGRLAEMVGLATEIESGSPGLPAWRAALALTHVAAGAHQQAEDILEEVMAGPARVFPETITWLLSHSVLAEVVAEAGTRQQAEREYAMLLPYAGRMPNFLGIVRPAVNLWLAMLAARVGRNDRASAHFAEAHDLHERLGAHVFLAKTRLEWGRFVMRVGDATTARSLVARAREDAVSLGAAGIAAAAEVLAGTDG
jgi:DNA-binding SARP family transcriptional activator